MSGSASGSSAASHHSVVQDDTASSSSQAVTRSSRRRACQSPACRKFLGPGDSHSLCLWCLGVDHDHAHCLSCLALEGRNLNLRLSAVQHFRDTGEWLHHPCSRARKLALAKVRAVSVVKTYPPSGPSKGKAKAKSDVVGKTASSRPSKSPSSEVPLGPSKSQESEVPDLDALPVDEETRAMTQGKFDRWSPDQPRSSSEPVAFYYEPEFYALSLDFPYLSEKRRVQVFQFLVDQYYQLKHTNHWFCLGEALDALCEDLMSDPDLCVRIIPEALEAEEDVTHSGSGTGFSSSDLPLVLDSVERTFSEEFSYHDPDEHLDGEDTVKVLPVPIPSPSKVEPRRPDKRPAPSPSGSGSKAKSSRPSESPSTRDKVDALAGMFQVFLERYEKDRSDGSASFKAPAPVPTIAVPGPSVVPSSVPDDLVSSVSKAPPPLTDEDKRVRELKADWLDLALPRCGLPSPPPKGPRSKDAFGSSLRQVRRDLVPLHSDVLELCQTNIREHFERLREGDRKVKEHAKRIPTFYQAPQPENKAFLLKHSVPSVLIDYLPEPVRDALKCGSADEFARLNANSALGRQEAEALLLFSRAKLGIQISNALTIDLLAVQNILSDLSGSVDQFVSTPPSVPTRLEDFSVWREHVRVFTTAVQRSVSDLGKGARDALLVIRDEINLHSQDLIKSQVDRRKAWLTVSNISDSVQKEINSLPFESFKKGDYSPPDLLGSRGTTRLASYQVVKTKMDKRAASQAPPHAGQASKRARGRKNRRNRGRRSADSLEQVGPLPRNNSDPDTHFNPPQPFRGNARGRGGGRGRRARGGRGQPSGRRGGQ